MISSFFNDDSGPVFLFDVSVVIIIESLDFEIILLNS